MIAVVEWEDFERHLPKLEKTLRERFEANKFIAYPKGLVLHLYGHELEAAKDEEKREVYDILYKRVNKVWSRKNFPKKVQGNIRGVYLNELNEFLGS